MNVLYLYFNCADHNLLLGECLSHEWNKGGWEKATSNTSYTSKIRARKAPGQVKLQDKERWWAILHELERNFRTHLVPGCQEPWGHIPGLLSALPREQSSCRGRAGEREVRECLAGVPSSLLVQQERGEQRLQRASQQLIFNQCPVNKTPRAGPAAGSAPLSSWEMKPPAAGWDFVTQLLS